MTWPRRYHEMCIGLQFKQKNMLCKSSYLNIWLCTEVCMKRNLIISYHLTIICLRCNSKWLTLEKHIIRLKIFYYDWMQVSHWLKDFTQQLSLYTSDTFTQLWEYFLTQRSYLCKKIEYNDFFNTLLTKKSSWLRTFLWFHAFKFPRSDSLHISHSQMIGSNSQFNKRQISDKCKQIMKAWSQNHSVSVLTVSLLNINTENLMHLDLLSIRLLNRASSLWGCTSPQTTWHQPFRSAISLY